MQGKQLKSDINQSIDVETYLCSQCRHEIPKDALLCSKCNSYQDWRRYISGSQISLALIAAILSITGIVIPEMYRLFHEPISKATISTSSVDGTTLRVTVLNRGDASAVLTKSWMDSEYLAGATVVRLRNDNDALIPPGSKLVIFDIIPLLSELQSYEGSMEMLGYGFSKAEIPKTEVRFELVQSNGDLIIQSVKLNADDLFNLLRANSNRCSAVAEPNFDNGCIGPGELE
ncbi:hypothetical protein [Shewanella frigidimarina]|uniref:hypothetical protein n=1 Tax=Shewanella frigidimarina TaxID=56812 RepID=UPI003D7BB027